MLIIFSKKHVRNNIYTEHMHTCIYVKHFGYLDPFLAEFLLLDF